MAKFISQNGIKIANQKNTFHMTTLNSIETFLSNEKVAVAGVSRKKQKFGNAIYNELDKKGFRVFPVNPNMDDYLGGKCYHSISDLPDDVQAIVINTKHDTTLRLIQEAKEKGIKHVWLQQGSLDKKAGVVPEEPGMNIIASECILMHAGDVRGVHAFHRWLKKSFGHFPS